MFFYERPDYVQDNCLVNSVHVVVIPAVVVPPGGGIGGEDDVTFITSERRRFWPAAYRTVLDVFSDSAVVSWPPVCSYATDGWVLEACTASNDADCHQVKLNGESPVHVASLKPCQLYKFR